NRANQLAARLSLGRRDDRVRRRRRRAAVAEPRCGEVNRQTRRGEVAEHGDLNPVLAGCTSANRAGNRSRAGGKTSAAEPAARSGEVVAGTGYRARAVVAEIEIHPAADISAGHSWEVPAAGGVA